MSGNYDLNTPYRDQRTGDIYSIQERDGSYWQVFETNRPSVRLPATAQAYVRPAQSVTQPGSRSQPRQVPTSTQARGNVPTYSSTTSPSQPIVYNTGRDPTRTEASRSGSSAPAPQSPYSSSPGNNAGDLTSSLNRLALGDTTTQPSRHERQGPAATTAQPSVTRARNLGNGFSEFTTTDPTAGVRTHWRFGPIQTFGEHDFRSKTIVGSDDGISDEEGDDDSDDSSDGHGRGKKPARSERQYRRLSLGDVIETALVPAPPDSLSAITMLTVRPGTNLPGGLHAGVRRFVVIDPTIQGGRMCSAIPIKTYNGLGVSAPGVFKFHHTVIYTEPVRSPAPGCLPSEIPPLGSREAPMQRQPILVLNRDRTRPLDPLSRLDFFDITHFDTSLRGIALYGRVHPDHVPRLESQRANVWSSFQLQASQPMPGPPQQNQHTASHGSRTRTSSMSAQATSSRNGSTGTTRQLGSGTAAAGSSTVRGSASNVPSRSSVESGQSRAEFENLRALIMSNVRVTADTIRSYLGYLDQMAQRSSIDRPPVLTTDQVEGLARDAPGRIAWFRRIHGVLGIRDQ